MKESQRNEKSLLAALDRFKSKRLEVVPQGSKLTRLNLAIEGGVSRDTPFSRYKKDHEKAGQYRFLSVTKQFFDLREKRNAKPKDLKQRDAIKELKVTVSELEHSLATSRSVANALDAELDQTRIRTKELEELSSSLAEENDVLRNEVLKLRKKRLK
jgi:hypothetical protein